MHNTQDFELQILDFRALHNETSFDSFTECSERTERTIESIIIFTDYDREKETNLLIIITLLLSIMIMLAFISWWFIENVCAISYTKTLRGFALTSCFDHFNSSRCFGSFTGKFNVINKNLASF